jgi:histidinol-phosphatase
VKPKSPELAFALRLGAAAADQILPRFPLCPVETKADGSVVTEADRHAEAAMRALIRANYPLHAILGEEEGETAGNEEHQWVLDPIDGTASFALGIPKFGTLVALLEHGLPRVGVVHLPFTSETLYAERGAGCWYTRDDDEPEPVRVDASAATLETASISVAGVERSEIRPGELPPQYQLTGLLSQAKRVAFVGDCIQHMLVARGRIHAALDTVMSPWDSAALVPCIQEAGGVVSTASGVTENVTFGGSLLTSGNVALHEAILRSLNASSRPEL